MRGGSEAQPLPRLGIVGGGQLGRMLAQAARTMGWRVAVLDPTPDAPAAQVADVALTGSLYDANLLAELAGHADVLTYDIEHIDAAALQRLADAGACIRPAPGVLATIQDKLAQKQVLADAGLPVPRFEALEAPSAEAFARFGYPLVHKARTGGYDGRGVAVLEGPQHLERALPGPGMLEPRVSIAAELAVMVARGTDGAVRSYPVVAMFFNPAANILDLLVAPADLPEETAAAARDIAERTVAALEGVGIFGVELFLDTGGNLLVNEVAPRPHNSGHYTIEACVTSQYEQHLRAIAGLPLGSTEQLRPAAMVNLLGAPGASGPVRVAGLADALALPGASVHIYGKAETRPGRKMGHVTVLAGTVEQARETALRAQALITITAEGEGA